MNRVLIVDDDAGVRAGLEIHFRRQGWEVRTASQAAEAVAKFRRDPAPLVVTDLRLSAEDAADSGMAVIAGVRAIAPATAVILLTAFGSVPSAVEAMQAGACDYLMKPVAFPHLLAVAERLLAARRDSAGAARGEPAPDAPALGSPSGPGVTAATAAAPAGAGAVVRQGLQRARQAAQAGADVLIEAESGAGKEVWARYLHASGPRRDRPFIAVNCAALPDTLLESELFGYVRGAFSGATAAKPGKFELADGGTLLLDEIGEMPLGLQPKLLRVLQQREVDRLGDTRPRPVDVQVIATTNQGLAALVAEGRFRADLYYRLRVVPLRIPPLRERREDIAALAELFLRRYAPQAETRGTAGGPLRLAPELMAQLTAWPWPGNVRELENFIRRAVALATGPVIGLEALEEEETLGPLPGMAPAESTGTTAVAEPGPGITPGLTWHEAERQLITATLAATGGNRTHAAQRLGISLRTMRNKIRAYQLPPRAPAQPPFSGHSLRPPRDGFGDRQRLAANGQEVSEVPRELAL
ncbi:MAG: sigma-54-dependent transcriptional regulator [Terriglobales bacterium]